MTDTSNDLQAMVAKAYGAIARPESLVDMLSELLAIDPDLADLGPDAQLHFDNAATILGEMYPATGTDFHALNTQADAALPCDLAVSRDLRVTSVNRDLFEDDLVEGTFAPDWLFDPVTMANDRERLREFSGAATQTMFRLFETRGDNSGRWFLARHADIEDQSMVLLSAVRLRWAHSTGRQFQSALHLTDTELALVRHLVTGGTLRGFAELRDRSIGTVRNQMKALQRKLSINSKEELLLLYVGFNHSLASPGGGEVTNHVCRNRFDTDGADGSRECIAWEEYGDPAGCPVLYFHALEGALLTDAVARSALAHGLRIIVPWRPHYGETTGSGRGLASSRDFAQRLPAFLDHLGIETCTGLGTQAGTPYLMAFAKAHPERLDKVVAAGPFLPVTDGSDYGFVPKRHRLQMRLARAVPAFASIYQRAMLATMGTGEFYRFVENYYIDCPRELRTVRDQDMVRMFRRSATYAVTENFGGTIETMLVWAADWGTLCDQLRVPVHLMVGAEDGNISPQFSYVTAQRYGFAPPVTIADAGSFLINDQPDRVMQAVARP